MTKEPLFKEEQKFTQWWLWLFFLGVTLIPVYGVWQQVIMGETFGDKPMSDTGLIVSTVLFLLLLILFRQVKLTTVITRQCVHMQWYPFVTKEMKWSEIASCEVIKYGFVGGWGIRYSPTHGMVYNIAGNKGLAITPKQGKKFIIGTQKSEEIESVLKRIDQLRDNNQS